MAQNNGHVINRKYIQRKKIKEIQQALHSSVLSEPKKRNYRL